MSCYLPCQTHKEIQLLQPQSVALLPELQEESIQQLQLAEWRNLSKGQHWRSQLGRCYCAISHNCSCNLGLISLLCLFRYVILNLSSVVHVYLASTFLWILMSHNAFGIGVWVKCESTCTIQVSCCHQQAPILQHIRDVTVSAN